MGGLARWTQSCPRTGGALERPATTYHLGHEAHKNSFRNLSGSQVPERRTADRRYGGHARDRAGSCDGYTSEGSPALRPHPFPPHIATACHTVVTPRPFATRRSSERRAAPATLVPEREDLDALRVRDHPVVDVVANARELKTTNAREGNVSGPGADLGLNGDEKRSAFELLANGVGRFRSVDAPPVSIRMIKPPIAYSVLSTLSIAMTNGGEPPDCPAPRPPTLQF
jgi:hypothetical protein